MPYTRAAIEKYIFNKLNDHLTAIYNYKNSEQDILFQARQAELKQRYQAKYDRHHLDWVNEIMGELDIKQKLRLLPTVKE